VYLDFLGLQRNMDRIPASHPPKAKKSITYFFLPLFSKLTVAFLSSMNTYPVY